MTVLFNAVTSWYCPNCGKRDQTMEAKPHSRFHTCPKLHMLTAPMLRDGTSAKVEVVERQDYLGKEIQQSAILPRVTFGPVRLRPRPKPVQAVVTTRDNGQDAAVFAPLARADAGA